MELKKQILKNELGFGQYRDKKISNFKTNDECEYLLWALKTVRIPKPLWDAIIEHLNNKVILNTEHVFGEKSELTKEELFKFKDMLRLDFSKFLEPRIEPSIFYKCDNCNKFIQGFPHNGYVSDNIYCNNCKSRLKIEHKDLRFYFGWYKGWRISDFKTSNDLEYLKWIITNVESLTPKFKEEILKKINY
ncbi:hypothetical protein F7642_12435 [Tenacibaculum finnmarkense genomovar ulcerans]|uniref:hypothetical protein n=1 Tax=Tenacibaculum TaxID=104267 RepID=UPI00187BB3B0|nr:hypothetical protein [Tenacibaculum finnmarkense]MBE7635130.1 hypothetical protein [Tenacibaculum finnmarkense genomovar ulcerans]MCD8431083.1 hypothetical protein [Tenacibaculum finnmarkense genomovar ulcerans]